MKYVLLYLFTTTILYGRAQDSTVALSRYEIFNAQKERQLKTISYELGDAGPFNIARFVSTVIFSGESSSAIKFYNGYLETKLVSSQEIFVDDKDLDSVIQILNYYIKESEQNKPKTNLFYSFTTKDDIQFSLSYSTLYPGWNFGMGKVYAVLRTRLPDYHFFNKRKATELVKLLTNTRNNESISK